MDGIAESPMEIVNLPLNVKVGFYGDSGPPAVKMAIDRESPTNAGIALPRLLELAIADAFAKFCNEPLHFITRFLNSLSCQHLRTSVYRHALLTAAPAVTLARIRPNPVPSTLPGRPRFLLRLAANRPIPSRTHFPVRRRAGKLSCGPALRAKPHSCALLFPWKSPPPEAAQWEWREGMRATVKAVQRAAAKSWRRIVPIYRQGLAETRSEEHTSELQ